MPNVNLIMLTDSRATAAEAYRTLRTNLMFSSIENPLHTLIVTSTAQADDKSIVLANLAVTFAQGGNKTILVDCDLRKPTQHDIWDISNERGLTSMMLDDSAMSTPPLVSTDIDGLQILPCGPLPPNPADILGSQRMNAVIGVLKARANYVLFDAPPILAATDAALLASKLEGVLLVIRAGQTRRDHTVRAREALQRVHVRIVGAVLSNAPKESVGGEYR